MLLASLKGPQNTIRKKILIANMAWHSVPIGDGTDIGGKEQDIGYLAAVLALVSCWHYFVFWTALLHIRATIWRGITVTFHCTTVSSRKANDRQLKPRLSFSPAQSYRFFSGFDFFHLCSVKTKKGLLVFTRNLVYLYFVNRLSLNISFQFFLCFK